LIVKGQSLIVKIEQPLIVNVVEPFPSPGAMSNGLMWCPGFAAT
jgi:hypothetical protein